VNPRAEAFERLGGRYEVRVLEPSPPAVDQEPWFADDPVARGEVPGGRELVSPVGNGDLRWDDLAREDPALAAWCGERWLGAYRRLVPLPEGFAETREALHRLAGALIAPARRHANGKIGLRYVRGGFGTPHFGADVQLRVEGVELVVRRDAGERRARLTSLAEAADLIGADLLPDGVEAGPEALVVDPVAAADLADWYGFATSVLEELRAEAGPELEPSRVQLWPEHFDVSVDLGSESAGRRAGYGASPGDERHPEPYLYVVPWSGAPVGELWQATGFDGAELPYAALLAADEQRAAALDFLRVRLRALR
jgi:hypothetical protein